MADFFLDSSAVVKRYVREAGSSWVRRLTDARAGHDVYVARVAAVEVVAAIGRRERSGELTARQAASMVTRFRGHLALRYNIIELTSDVADRAADLARSRGLRAYDSVQLATALTIDALNRDAGFDPVTFVCADVRLLQAAAVEGLVVEDPNKHP